MDESILLKSAVTTSLIGLAALFLISNSIETPYTTSIVNQEEDSDIRIIGAVSDLKKFGKLNLIEVTQACSTSVLVFDKRNQSISKGDFVEITGNVREFKGQKEIIADKIELLIPQ